MTAATREDAPEGGGTIFAMKRRLQHAAPRGVSRSAYLVLNLSDPCTTFTSWCARITGPEAGLCSDALSKRNIPLQSGDDAERQRLVDRFGNLVVLVHEARYRASRPVA
jgi:hypothetical protein